MASMGTIGNVLNAAGVRNAVDITTYITGSTWSDTEANSCVHAFANGGAPIMGDSVTMIELPGYFGCWRETRCFDGTAWVAVSSMTPSWTGAQPFKGFPRSPANLSRKGYSSWSDFGALAAINDAGHAFVVDGDCVTLYDDTWTETRYYKDGKWVEDSLYFPGVLSAPTTPSQPGIADEVKPDLMTKKLRSW